MSIDKNVFLGGNENGPAPIWRNEAEDSASWPEGAVFKIHFTPENSPGASIKECAIPRVDFFGSDGWPIDLPAEQKAQLSEAMKLEFQVFPCNWQAWNGYEWQRAVDFPECFAETRAFSKILHPLAQVTSSLSSM